MSNETPTIPSPPGRYPSMEINHDNVSTTAFPLTDISFSKPVAEAPQPTNFFLFRKFPLEIRKMIWTATTLKNRIVEIDSKDVKNRQKKTEERYRSKTLVPVLLHVSHESRSIGLTIYQPLSFGGLFTGTYIDWEHDFIFFNNYHPTRPGYYRAGIHRNGLDNFLISRQRYQGKLINQELKEKCRKVVFDGKMRGTPLALKDLKKLECLVAALGIAKAEGDMDLVSITDVDFAGYSKSNIDNYHKMLGSLHKIQKTAPSIKEVQVMNIIKQPYHGLSPARKNAIKIEKIDFLNENGLEMPKEPVRAVFKNDKVASLKAKARYRGLSKEGLKKDLLERLEVAEDIRFAEAMEKYQSDLEEYWAVMTRFEQGKIPSEVAGT